MITEITKNKLISIRNFLNRIGSDHPRYQKVLDDYQNRLAGIRGEERLKAKLVELRLRFPYVMLYDVKTYPTGTGTFKLIVY